MNDLQIFKHPEFGEVRAVEVNGEPWLVGKDIAIAVGHENPQRAIRNHVDAEDKGVTELVTPGGKQELVIINESGLYSLILSSKLPKAKEYKRWVTSEVLPAIRKHGGYLTSVKLEEALTNPDVLIRLATDLKNEQAEKARLAERIKQDRPKVLFAESVSVSDDTISMGAMAKILNQNGVEIGRNRLFAWLNENKYLMTEGGKKNIPTQTSMEKGLFEVLESEVFRPSGESILTLTTKVTGKGQTYLINKFLKAEKAKENEVKES